MQFRLIVTILFLSMASCREKYNLPFEKSVDSYLVVEGNILDGDTTIIRLSRTSPLSQRGLSPEQGAVVQIEGDDNTVYHLSENENGIYKSEFLVLQPAVKYRLSISSGDRRYESEFTSLVQSPDIDTVTWKRENGVEIFVSSQGTESHTRYYKWDYEEVFEFRSKYDSKAFFTTETKEGGRKELACIDIERYGMAYNTCIDAWFPPFGDKRNDSLFYCWRYEKSTTIHVGSTASLGENVVYMPVRKIADNAFELDYLYSILVKQTGISKEAYEFYKILEGNSENVGSIFDAQPSQLKTNITCVTNPAEPVIGFIDATSVRSRRIFISKSELPGWDYIGPYCAEMREGINVPDSVRYYNGLGLLPVEVLEYDNAPPHRIFSFSLAPAICVDCTMRGGVHRKPAYWP